LTRLVATAKAREHYFLGDIIDGAAAAALGLVNRVVEDEALCGKRGRSRDASPTAPGSPMAT
jgi:enoyl-CoA hydratase/carnithine racemase